MVRNEGTSAGERARLRRLALAAVIGLTVAAFPMAGRSQNVAPAVLSQTDLTNIASVVASAIVQAKASVSAGSSQPQIDTAIAQAISQTTQTEITQYGGANVSAIVDAVVFAANNNGASASALGQGLALAALAEGSTLGASIAREFGSVASADAVAQFDAVARASGGALGAQLASDANSSLEIAQGGAGGPLGVGAPAGAAGSPCPNPSCT